MALIPPLSIPRSWSLCTIPRLDDSNYTLVLRAPLQTLHVRGPLRSKYTAIIAKTIEVMSIWVSRIEAPIVLCALHGTRI